MSTTDTTTAILTNHLTILLASRAPPKTICPSEVARALSSSDLAACEASSWRDLMPAIRTLAFQLREAGELEVLQRGRVLGADITEENVRGPIRLRQKCSDKEEDK
jgi:Protein of unknown function (DUF3253)